MAAYSRRVIPIAITRAVPADRTRDLGLLFGLLAWLVYTKFFFTLRAGHLVLPPCPFFYLTGHPCPFCGGPMDPTGHLCPRANGFRRTAATPEE